MPKVVGETPKVAKPYMFHGLDLSWGDPGGHALGDCPFCGGDDLEVTDMDGDHYVLCHGCALEAPFHDSRAEAVAAWNRRAAIAAPQPSA